MKYLICSGFGRILEGLRPKSLILIWFWKEFGRLGAEIFDFVSIFGRILEDLGLKSLIFFRFWQDFEELEAEILDSL